jgi:murein DD-endopeptidase MepM/ murein hydrolase activator NlpD
MRPIAAISLSAALALACVNPFPLPLFSLGAHGAEEEGSPPATADAAPERYVVQPGDTLHAIARWQNTSVEELARANGLADPDRLDVGQELVMPPGAKPTSPRPTHRSPQRAAPANPGAEPAPGEAALLPLDCAILDTDESLRNARFEEALIDARRARSLLEKLEPQPGVARRKARLEVLSGMAEVALGRDEAARGSFERALEADPLLALEPGAVSPKIFRIFEEVRTGPPHASR